MDKARDFIGSPDTPATILHVILLKHFGAEFLYGSDDQEPVDPVILWNEIEEDFRISIPVEVENKMNAMMTACSTSFFFSDVAVFSAVCVALASGDLGDEMNGEFDKPSTYEMLCSIQEVDINDGDREILFSPQVKAYILEVLNSENVDTEEEIDHYEADVSTYMDSIVLALQELGVPPNTIVIPEDSDFYGLLEGGH